jgi:hypothetical protein
MARYSTKGLFFGKKRVAPLQSVKFAEKFSWRTFSPLSTGGQPDGSLNR